ncbi:hypothetical protein L9F63_011822, partial [Diploptera punctata]
KYRYLPIDINVEGATTGKRQTAQSVNPTLSNLVVGHGLSTRQSPSLPNENLDEETSRVTKAINKTLQKMSTINDPNQQASNKKL